MPKAICIETHDNYSYEVRVKYIEKILLDRDYDVEILTADYDHRNKKRYRNERKNLRLLHVIGYKRNISIKRILSHIQFAWKSYLYLSKVKPDLVYATGAPNSIYAFVSKYKRKNKESFLIFDVTDLWPETFPFSIKTEKLLNPILKKWRSLRTNNLQYADYVLFECGLFEEIVRKELRTVKGETLYLCEDDLTFAPDKQAIEGLNLLYLGSINNIIDICIIEKLIERLQQFGEVTVHIVGDGERREELCRGIEKSGGHVVFHGVIYDSIEKAEIYKRCAFALNIMKENVCVGATMKSIEYFRAGLCVINTIAGDTQSFVDSYKCGFNINNENIDLVADKIHAMNTDDIRKMMNNSRKVYEEYFSTDVFMDKMNRIVDLLEEKIK